MRMENLWNLNIKEEIKVKIIVLKIVMKLVTIIVLKIIMKKVTIVKMIIKYLFLAILMKNKLIFKLMKKII